MAKTRCRKYPRHTFAICPCFTVLVQGMVTMTNTFIVSFALVMSGSATAMILAWAFIDVMARLFATTKDDDGDTSGTSSLVK